MLLLLLWLVLLLQACTEEQLLPLVHEGGLINKLRGIMPQHMTMDFMSFSIMQNGPQAAITLLTAVWSKKAHELSKQISKRIQGGLRRVAGGLSCKRVRFLQHMSAKAAAHAAGAGTNVTFKVASRPFLQTLAVSCKPFPASR
jgi:hypothetical protein